MTRFVRKVARLLLGSAAVLQALAPVESAVSPSTRCSLSEPDRAWLDQVFAAWAFVAREKLMLGDPALPRIITFDQRCVYSLGPGPNRPRPWSAVPHRGTIRLPNGQAIPTAPTAYAAYNPANGGGFFVMSLPAVWRSTGHQSALGLEAFLQGVMIHELTHAYQFYFASPRLDALMRRYGLPDDMTDESLQQAFRHNAAYVADFESERDVLFRSAAAPDAREARRLACEGLARLQRRRARYFVGANQKWAPLDEIYLTMEGEAQWAMYSWWTDPRGKGLPPAVALPNVRSGGASWVQDEGLAAFLVIDRLVPGWQRLAFARQPETVQSLLARACR